MAKNNNRQILSKSVFAAVMILLFLGISFAFLPHKTLAAQEYTSPETGYEAVVEDNADLFTDEEEANLLAKLKELLPYANFAIVTNTERNYDANDFAREWFLERFGQVSGSVFLIDMYNRRIEIFSGQEMFREISTARANEITDNIYTYATAGDYYTCADKAFDQIRAVLEGRAIYTPMKYATNAAFAAGVVLLVNFIIIYRQRKKSKDVLALRSAMVSGKPKGAVQDVKAVMTSQRKTRHVESSGGGGFSGGGGGFSGGGGGGGGFSGGGGGHSF